MNLPRRSRASSWWLALVLVAVPVFAQGPLTPSAPAVNTLYTGTTPVTVGRAIIDAATNGDNLLVDGVAGSRICVLALHLTMTGTAVTIRFEDTGSGTALSGQMQPTQGQSIVLPFNPACWYRTSVANAFSMELSGAQSVDGALVYALVP